MNPPVPEHDYVFKVTMLGDYNAGRTSFSRRYSENKFDGDNNLTIGLEFIIKKIDNRDRKIKLMLWDNSGGRERFRAMSRAYIRGSHAVLIFMDLTHPSDTRNIESYKRELEESFNAADFPLVLLVGSKSDARKICFEDAKSAADYFQLPYFECSSKTGEGVEELMQYVINNIQDKFEAGPNRSVLEKPAENKPQQNSYCTIL